MTENTSKNESNQRILKELMYDEGESLHKEEKDQKPSKEIKDENIKKIVQNKKPIIKDEKTKRLFLCSNLSTRASNPHPIRPR